MINSKVFDEHYRSLSDAELLKLAAEGGFTAEAKQSLSNELAHRRLTLDEARRRFTPEWLDKTEVGALGTLTLVNGEQLAVQIAGVNEDGDRLSVQVIPSEGFTRKGLPKRRSHRYIPFHRIASFELRPDLLEEWPFSDPCRSKSSGLRLTLMSGIFICMMFGSVGFALLLSGARYELQIVSSVIYTLFVVFFTFATTGSRGGGNVPGYKFTCPAVMPQIPRLLSHHLLFLAALFAIETAAPTVHRYMPVWWDIPDRKGSTPFEGAILLLCIALLLVQIFMNKSILNKAHRNFSIDK